jgi:hypothetical protein
MEPPAEERSRWDGWLGPRHWIPAGSVLGIAVVALAVLLALGVNGGDGPQTVVKSCQVGEPGCELRQPIHQHADFALYIRGQRFDFHQDRFVSKEGSDIGFSAHIHDPRYSVVHVHLSGTTWDEFFRSLGFELVDPTVPGTKPETTCLKVPGGEKLCNNDRETFKFYLNGVKVDGVSFLDIHDLDRMLISYGSETDEQVRQQQLPQVTDEACIPSELCKERIPQNETPDPCTLSNNSCVIH